MIDLFVLFIDQQVAPFFVFDENNRRYVVQYRLQHVPGLVYFLSCFLQGLFGMPPGINVSHYTLKPIDAIAFKVEHDFLFHSFDTAVAHDNWKFQCAFFLFAFKLIKIKKTDFIFIFWLYKIFKIFTDQFFRFES